MMKHNSNYPIKHLSVRVPWHDNGWDGTICRNPKANSACLVLKNCAENRDDEKEDKLSGKSIRDLSQDDYPVCASERGVFMAGFPIRKVVTHPYFNGSPKTHGHLKPTTIVYPPFSFSAVPYRWVLKENAELLSEAYNLDYADDREPVLDWGKPVSWVQEIRNQKALLNCFFEHLDVTSSLVFAYAKQVPFIEDNRKVLIGVGKINDIKPSEAYEGSNEKFGTAYWEHMIPHSIRNDCKDGFLLPYNEAIDFQKANPEFDINDIAVSIPDDKHLEFSYASEHVSNDAAIRILLECLQAFENAEENGIGKHNQLAIKWIHNEISKLDKLRGAYPGMGAALCAFGIEKGHFVAAEIVNNLKDDQSNPWRVFERIAEGNTGIIHDRIESLIPENTKALYKSIMQRKPDRLSFLHLLSRFDLSIEQAIALWIEEERTKYVHNRRESEYLVDPYLIYTDLRLSTIPVDIKTIDMGLYAKENYPDLLPVSMRYTDPLASNRIKAFTIHQLEIASNAGHTLLPRKDLVNQIRSLGIRPECPINSDYYDLAEDGFSGDIAITDTASGDRAYQLNRYVLTKNIISKKIMDRVKGQKLLVSDDWEATLNSKLPCSQIDDQEQRARHEKVAALQTLAESRFSLLIGPAGTGKTTLLTILAGQHEIMSAGVLFLAPTGKARVRMEEIARDINITAKTIAQFLVSYSRYDTDTGRYVMSDKRCTEPYQTVIIDECSMLTEEMLSTTMDCLQGVKRFILVGDHRQLPPIGAGRPFVDIVNYLRPSDIDSSFPKVAPGYAELTIRRRQGGASREDLQLAEWFGGGTMEPAAESVFKLLISKKASENIRVERWQNEDDFNKLLEQVLHEELAMESFDDLDSFNKSLGAVDNYYFNKGVAVHSVEDWQILSPVRGKLYGVSAINRKIHKQFRSKQIQNKYRKLPEPLGSEQIVYGDKVINVINKSRDSKSVYPFDGLNYLANGEIGVVIGQFRKKADKQQPKNTHVEFTSQKGYTYTFWSWMFSEEGESPLELAYALTIHKAQGSEFGTTFIVIPQHCSLLSREMIYTALTRQKGRVVMLLQGEGLELLKYSSPLKSETLSRITNLFFKPNVIDFDGHYLEKNLIHQAEDGVMLRSKSELIIYQLMLKKGIKPMYEKRITIKDVVILPDFIIENDDTGVTYYWEHCGMMHDPEYVERWSKKLTFYRENEILPYQEGVGRNGTLIVTEEKLKVLENGQVRGAFSVQEIEDIIDKVLLG